MELTAAQLVVGAIVVVVAVAGIVAAVVAHGRRQLVVAVNELVDRQVADHDASLDRAIVQLERLNRHHLQSRGDLIGAGLDHVRDQVHDDLARLSELLRNVGDATVDRFGRVDQALRMHADVTGKLATSTSSLREALASPTARGQWGERMAEDILRLAGFVENVNYRKQQTSGNGRPDFTFDLPKGHVLHMDVKFPLAGYLRYLDADTDLERQQHLTAFLRDVRARVKELARRRYQSTDSASPSLNYVLMFLPNEHLSGFIHEHDPALIDDALKQQVVMCSPLTLYAFLGVIRQAFDNFVVEQTSTEVLELVSVFEENWQRYTDSAAKVKRHFETAHAEFDRLTGQRQRTLDTQLGKLDALRRRRADGGADEADDDGVGDGAPALRVVDSSS